MKIVPEKPAGRNNHNVSLKDYVIKPWWGWGNVLSQSLKMSALRYLLDLQMVPNRRLGT